MEEEEQEYTPVSAPQSGGNNETGEPMEMEEEAQRWKDEASEEGSWNKRGSKRGWLRNETPQTDTNDQDWAWENGQEWKGTRTTGQQWGYGSSQSSNQDWYGQNGNGEETTQSSWMMLAKTWGEREWYEDGRKPRYKRW